MIKQAGYTLVEVLVALTVVGILLGVIGTFSVQALNQSSSESARATQLGEAHIAMDKVINDIRLSGGAEENNRWPDSNNTNGIYGWESNASNLVLSTAVTDQNDDIIFADKARYVSEKNDSIYFIKNKTLYKRTLASTVLNNTAKTTCPTASASCPADNMLLSNVTAFVVKYYDGDGAEVAPADSRSVELRVQSSVRKFGRDITTDYSTRAVFRND